MTRRARLRALALITLVFPLVGGCVTLLPKRAPDALYRFGDASAPSPPGALAPSAALDVRVTMAEAVRGDAILAMTGREAAYLSGGRWVSSARDLFKEAAVARLSPAWAGCPQSFRVDFQVSRFEVDYDPPAGSLPSVRIQALVGVDRGAGGMRSLGRASAEVQARDNSLSAIVEAFDAAVGTVLTTSDLALATDAQSPARERTCQRLQANKGLPVSPR